MDYLTEFQSHSKEFDPLRSMEIEETVTGLSWLSPQGKYLKILSTNNKNIKLWKIYQKTEKKIVKPSTKDLNLPKLQSSDSSFAAHLQVSLPPKHLSSINSISGSKNEQYLLSSDDVQALYWNY